LSKLLPHKGKRPPPLPVPQARRLQVYAFDPSAALELGSSKFSHATISLPWDDSSDGALRPGPVNDYVEVIDIDPCSRQFYAPIDLEAPEVLGQNGLPPTERDPRFHQQMVFAVVMKTIKLFERALGRKVLWAPEWNDQKKTYEPTLKLRIYPHALREANAYYSRSKRALLFGYFNATQRSAGATWIFTALSHDIIVHETTHAILDGLHPRFAEPTSVDSLAFHEGFADIAALFVHFQLEEAVRDHIARCGGELGQKGLLSGLARQFAQGTSGRMALRDFIDKDPKPEDFENATEAHDRGAILVAAVFDAFLAIYRNRTADLLRIAGVEPDSGASLHPDLVARLAGEASKTADHVLRMCIRALDYMPPVDVRMGEFLRAIITADADLIPDDQLNYRIAFVEAFRRRGIYPENVLSMSPDNLLWDPPVVTDESDPLYLATDSILNEGLNLVAQFKRGEIMATAEENRRKVWYWLTQPELAFAPDGKRLDAFLARARAAFALGEDRAVERFLEDSDDDLTAFGVTGALRTELDRGLRSKKASHFARWEILLRTLRNPATRLTPQPGLDRAWERELGIYFQRPDPDLLNTIRDSASGLSVEVHKVRLTRRAGPDGQDVRQLVIEVLQRRRAFFDPAEQCAQDKAPQPGDGVDRSKSDFFFRGGATLIIDLRDGKLRYVIRKCIDDAGRLDLQRQYLQAPGELGFTYNRGETKEPFAMLHRI